MTTYRGDPPVETGLSSTGRTFFRVLGNEIKREKWGIERERERERGTEGVRTRYEEMIDNLKEISCLCPSVR